MSNTEKLKSLLEEARSEQVFSAYQVFAERGNHSLEAFGGMTSYWPDAVPVTAATWFDIGSVTKAVVTAGLFACAVEANEVSLTDPIENLVPEFKNSPYGLLTVGQLLSHTAGLKWWVPFFEQKVSRSALVGYLLKHAAEICETKPGMKCVYSDIGYWILGLIIERRWQGVAQAFAAKISGPLQLSQVRFGPISPKVDVAATEFRNERRLVQGEVFDENCAALGGVAAHAGIFATARGLGRVAAEWLRAVTGNSPWLGQKTATLFSSRAGLVADSTWGYGWDTKSAQGSSAGSLLSAKSFGHLGYPGCSVWIDPEAQGFIVFLTNRVHPSRHDERIRKLRPRVHEEIVRIW